MTITRSMAAERLGRWEWQAGDQRDRSRLVPRALARSVDVDEQLRVRGHCLGVLKGAGRHNCAEPRVAKGCAEKVRYVAPRQANVTADQFDAVLVLRAAPDLDTVDP